MPLSDIESRITELEGKSIADKGAIEILMAFLFTRVDKTEVLTFIKTVAESGKFSKEATLVAKKHLDLDSSFGEQVFQPGQTKQ